MPISKGIYYQSQSGGLCRMHSINAFFETDKLSLSQFNKYQKEYDKIYKKRFNIISCKLFDIITSDQKNLVSYILQCYNIYTRYFSINQLKNAKVINENIQGDFFFIYNESHIYGARRKNNKWYTVDSISGVKLSNLNRIVGTKNIGFIIPVNACQEFYRNIKCIKDIFPCKSRNLQFIEKYLINLHEKKLILGELEIPISICVNILEFQYNRKSKKPNEIDYFKEVKLIIDNYNTFIENFTNGNYTNIKLILQYVPEIILWLLKR